MEGLVLFLQGKAGVSRQSFVSLNSESRPLPITGIYLHQSHLFNSIYTSASNCPLIGHFEVFFTRRHLAFMQFWEMPLCTPHLPIITINSLLLPAMPPPYLRLPMSILAQTTQQLPKFYPCYPTTIPHKVARLPLGCLAMVSDNREIEKSPIHLGGKITNILSCNPTKNRQGEKQAASLPSLRESWKWFSTMTSAEDVGVDEEQKRRPLVERVRPAMERAVEGASMESPSTVEDQETVAGGRAAWAEPAPRAAEHRTAVPRGAPGRASAPPAGGSPAPGEPAAPSILVDGGGERRLGLSTVVPVPYGPADADAGSRGSSLGRMAEPSRGFPGTSFPAPRGLIFRGSQVPTVVPTKWRTSSPPAAAMAGALKPGLDRAELCVSPKGGGPGEGRFAPRSRSQNRDQESPSALSGASLAESEEENTPIRTLSGCRGSATGPGPPSCFEGEELSLGWQLPPGRSLGNGWLQKSLADYLNSSGQFIRPSSLVLVLADGKIMWYNERLFGMDTSSVGGLELTDQTPVLLGSTAMATSLTNVGNSFSGPANPLVSRSNKFQNSSVEDDDDVVFIEPVQPPPPSVPVVADQRTITFTSSKNEELQGNDSKITPSSKELASQKRSVSETIVIDDEEDMETNQGQEKNSSNFIERRPPETKNRTNDVDFSTSSFSRSKTKTGVGPFNPGRMNVAGDVFQNGESATHHNPDSWISQSASFPRNQKQPGVDSLSPVASLPKQIFQPSVQQQPTKPVKVTCANCKKPLQKGQTAYQRKGSAHLFCSTTCLSSFSHKPAPKKLCVMCKKWESLPYYFTDKETQSDVFGDNYVGSHPSFLKEVRDHMQDSFLMQPEKYGKLTTCTGCRTQCRFFDMTQCIGPNGYMEPYCSTACMNSHKTKYAKSQSLGIICHFCKRNSLPQYQATMPDGKLYNFCNSSCVAKFQALSMQSSPNGQFVAPSDIQLKCNYCKNSFCSKPEILEWENKVHQFCSKTCSDDYKKLHCIVTYCEYCQEEKTLHETVNFSGVKRPFCSEGCKLLYKQDFARRLGLRCVTCNYCSQLCKKGATKELDGVVRDFCSEDCCKKFQDWYYKAARCDCCKSQGTLKERVQWRGEMKHFCDQHCLLRFYCQQNEPNMTTQKGPENLHYDQGCQTSRTKMTGSAPPPSPTPNKEMKNKAVLCKPLTMTKATYCKPHMQTKSCQT
ncbi:hypothetical protein H8959_013971, partial [Pygathrix nigripes]